MSFEIRNATAKLGQHLALNAVSATIAPGRITAVLGPNGAGKTTLARVLAGLTPLRSGTVTLGGTAIASMPAKARAQRVGYLAQSIIPAWHVTARELVNLGRLPHLGQVSRYSDFDHAAVEAAMRATDTLHLADRTVDAMSGGERARVQIARVLAGEPQWIIADEPLANLDPPHQRDVLKLLRNSADSGTGVVIILHQINAAARIADDVIMMRRGEIIATGACGEALTAETLEAVFDITFNQSHVGSAPIFSPRD